MSSPYVPLRVTCRPVAPIITSPYLSLDGVLLSVHQMLKRNGLPSTTRPGIAASKGQPGLPIKKRGPHDYRYYACSMAVWDQPVAFDTSHWAKRIASQRLHYLDENRSSIPLSSGRFRPIHMPVATAHARKLTWYVVGDPERMRWLLHWVDHLGKKPAQGWGKVVDWRVDEVDEDWSCFDGDGRLMRPLPVCDRPGPEAVMRYGICPPYWLSRHQVMASMPELETLGCG